MPNGALVCAPFRFGFQIPEAPTLVRNVADDRSSYETAAWRILIRVVSVDALTRGDLVSVARQGDSGKRRHALVLQTDRSRDHATMKIVPLTSTLNDARLLRITITLSAVNGLHKISQLMVDKTTTVQRSKIGVAFGRIDPDQMLELERNLALFLGIAK